jgi:hypothetical protein
MFGPHREAVLTDAFSVGWTDATHRVLRSAVAAAEALADDIEMWLLVLLCGDDADLCGGTGGGVRRVAVGLCFI